MALRKQYSVFLNIIHSHVITDNCGTLLNSLIENEFYFCYNEFHEYKYLFANQ